MYHHLLPTLPDPPHDHEMAHDTPDSEGQPPDIGTGGAAFFVAVIVLAVTLLMGILAISQLKGGSLFASTLDSAAASRMESPQMRATPASAAMR